jgi:hypothetical protein
MLIFDMRPWVITAVYLLGQQSIGVKFLNGSFVAMPHQRGAIAFK